MAGLELKVLFWEAQHQLDSLTVENKESLLRTGIQDQWTRKDHVTWSHDQLAGSKGQWVDNQDKWAGNQDQWQGSQD